MEGCSRPSTHVSETEPNEHLGLVPRSKRTSYKEVLSTVTFPHAPNDGCKGLNLGISEGHEVCNESAAFMPHLAALSVRIQGM